MTNGCQLGLQKGNPTNRRATHLRAHLQSRRPFRERMQLFRQPSTEPAQFVHLGRSVGTGLTHAQVSHMNCTTSADAVSECQKSALKIATV